MRLHYSNSRIQLPAEGTTFYYKTYIAILLIVRRKRWDLGVALAVECYLRRAAYILW